MKQKFAMHSFVLLAVMFLAVNAFAQEVVIRTNQEGTQPARVRISPEHAAMVQAQMEPRFGLAGGTVKGQPYSADATTETNQTLGDGTRIHRSSSYTIYRDAEGRVRRETPNEIWISDPVANVSYVLNPLTNKAHKIPLMRTFQFAKSPGEPATAFVYGGPSEVNIGIAEKKKAMAERERQATGFASEAEGSAMKKKMLVEREGGAAASGGWVTVTDNGGEPGVVTFTVNGAGAGGQVFERHAAMAGERSEEQNEELGARAFEGVQAKGVKHTVTVPQGQIGNDRPIQYVTERWFSPELQVTILSKNSDPMNGETTFQLSNIKRTAPDASLFQLPSSYQLVEEPTMPAQMKRRMD
jgi:hypothetical protein